MTFQILICSQHARYVSTVYVLYLVTKDEILGYLPVVEDGCNDRRLEKIARCTMVQALASSFIANFEQTI